MKAINSSYSETQAWGHQWELSAPPSPNIYTFKENQCPAELDSGYAHRSLNCEKQSQAWHGGAICAEAALPTQGGPRPCLKACLISHRKDCILASVKKGQGTLWARDSGC